MHQNFVPFELERVMSIWEYQVEYNLSESGVHPMSLRELAQDPQMIDSILDLELNYPQTNGSIELRDQIARYYPGANRSNVVVTNGAAQANFTSIITGFDPGDEIVVMLPNYMQIWGIAQNLGLKVRTFSLKEELGWKIDIDELNQAVTPRTRLIAICNPNNPTGHIMTQEERQAVIQAAQRVGAWILADEVYAGAEHWTDEITPTFWGEYERVLAIGSLSKAYGLPGLRIGWVVAPAEMADEIWARQDYVSISASILSDKIAAYALSPQNRPWVMARARKWVRQGYDHFERWCRKAPEMFSYVKPQAAAIAFVRYNRKINSSELVNRLITEKKTFVVPGDHFGLDHHLRISYGLSDSYVAEGLNRIYDLLKTVD